MHQIIHSIITFLVKRGWVLETPNGNFLKLIPPKIFSFPEEFRIELPKNSNKAGFGDFIRNTINSISEIYEVSTDDLNSLLINQASILKLRIADSETSNGTIPLNRFDEFVNRIRQILTDTASFVINKSPISNNIPDEALRYIGLCRFMQTDVGSFITKFQLPFNEIIRDKEVFDDNIIYSKEVNSKLIEIFTFINNEILEGDLDVTDDFLMNNENLVNIKLYKDIYYLFEKNNIKNLDFTLHEIDKTHSVFNDSITRAKIFKLHKFVEKIESDSFVIDNFSFTGRITSLVSNDPDGLKNKIKFISLVDNIPITVSANLDSENYRKAIEAHKIKQNITITGLAKKTKTQAKFVEILGFNIEE